MTLTQMRKGIVKLLGLALLLVTIHYPLAIAVLAHSDYDRSVPAADEVVLQAPQQVQAWFTQELFRRECKNSLEVYGPDQQRIDLDDAAIDDDDRKLMTVSLQPDLADGDYTVRWRTLSADDGDEADGEFRFTVRAGSPTPELVLPAPTDTALPVETAPEATPTAESASSGSGEPPSEQESPGTGLPCMGSSFPVLLLLGALMLRRGRGKKN